MDWRPSNICYLVSKKIREHPDGPALQGDEIFIIGRQHSNILIQCAQGHWHNSANPLIVDDVEARSICQNSSLGQSQKLSQSDIVGLDDCSFLAISERLVRQSQKNTLIDCQDFIGL